MERGTVVAYNPATRKLAVAVDGDSCAVYALNEDYQVEVGHRLRGHLESKNSFAIENLSTGEMMDVTPLGVHVPAEKARQATEQ